MDDFIGEIRYFCFNYVPRGWLPCDGRDLRIAEYQGLAVVIGTAFGGDGKSTFKIPDLRGRAAMDISATDTPPYTRGAVFGSETVTLRSTEMPPHSHQMVRPGGAKPYAQKFSSPNSNAAPGSLALASGSTVKALMKTGQPDTSLHQLAVTSAGAGQPHDNMQPYQVFTAGICYEGVFPPRP